jgi:alpha-tubulin suppressor-like RCC1 family protein
MAAPNDASTQGGDVKLLAPTPVAPCLVALGPERSCVADGRGTLWCWGRDPIGQGLDSISPNVVAGLHKVSSVSLGASHICAVAMGQVFCWGQNTSGQLGDGSTAMRRTPMRVVGIDDAVEVVAGSRTTCVLRAAGRLDCWGDNSSHQLGVAGAALGERVLTPVHVLDEIQRVAIGGAHICVFGMGEEVRCWGDNSNGQLGDGSNQASMTPIGLGFEAADLAAGYAYTCAIAGDGGVRCWGDNVSGQLGDGTTGDPIAGTKAVGRTTAIATRGVDNAIAVSAGSAQSCAVLDGGEVRCWGANQFGLLAHGGDVGEVAVSAQPATLLLEPVSRFALTSDHACATFVGEGLLCWGSNSYGQLGNATTSSSMPQSPRPVAVAGFASCK